mgnify:CR=1 FL=1|jgi:hypothetical protein
MSNLSKRSTICFDPTIHQALREKAALACQSISDLVDGALRVYLSEDKEDFEAFSTREHEPDLSYETLLNCLKR